MSTIGDIMAGLKTAIELTGKVDRLERSAEGLSSDLRDLDRRLVRLETIIEVTRSDGATLRIAHDPKPE
jgi:hypothetical protein